MDSADAACSKTVFFSWKLIGCCCKRQGGICCGSPENIQFKNSIAGKDRGSLSEAAMEAGSLPKRA